MKISRFQIMCVSVPFVGFPDALNSGKLLFVPYIIFGIFLISLKNATLKSIKSMGDRGKLLLFLVVMFFLSQAFSISLKDSELVIAVIFRNCFLPASMVILGVSIASMGEQKLKQVIYIWTWVTGLWTVCIITFGSSAIEMTSFELSSYSDRLWGRGYINPFTMRFENATGLVASSAITVVAPFLAVEKRKLWDKILYSMPVISLIWISYMVQTRGGFVLLFISFIIWLYLRKLDIATTVITGIGVLLLITYGSGALDGILFERATISYAEERGLTGRKEIWSNRLTALDITIFGSEGKSFYATDDSSSHNQYLDILIMYGFVPFLLIITSVILVCVSGIMLCKKYTTLSVQRGVLSVLIAIVCHSFIESHIFMSRQLYQYTWFLIGVLIYYTSVSRRKINSATNTKCQMRPV